AEREAAAQRLARPVVREIVQALLAHVPVPRAATSDLGRRLAGARFASLDDALDAFRTMGLGELRLVAQSGARFEFAGRDLIESRAVQAQPTCHLSLSFLEGALSSLHGRAALGSEMRCQSMRHGECRFIVMLKDGK
ncbi:MAG TPA: hypothetical protein VHH36_07400, partial [Candidatus Thermoplasmatota archaeon]|nr:hypothetical protein [Candidatus Thermoplasmatota archaeon]